MTEIEAKVVDPLTLFGKGVLGCTVIPHHGKFVVLVSTGKPEKPEHYAVRAETLIEAEAWKYWLLAKPEEAS